MIRKATAADIPRLVELSIDILKIDQYEQLVIDPERVRDEVEDCVTDPTGFAWVSENKDGIQGGLGAIVLPMPHYERKQCQIVMLYCKIPGDGARLLREFMKWMKTKPMIRQVLYLAERGADPRIGKLIYRLGFKEALSMYVLTR